VGHETGDAENGRSKALGRKERQLEDRSVQIVGREVWRAEERRPQALGRETGRKPSCREETVRSRRPPRRRRIPRSAPTEEASRRRRMIAHVVLFRPKAGLSTDERQGFVDALDHALKNIPLIKRATIGRRITLGRLYDQQNPADYPFAAILEFENEADLRAYLDHDAHQALGQQFYLKADAALVFDYAAVARAAELVE
jgi:hypothetical protein